MQWQWVEQGDITFPRGWSAGAAYAGIKTYGPEPRLDIGLLYSNVPAVAAGVFTKNLVCGAPVSVSRDHLADSQAQALIVNSGCSNVATGVRGVEHAREMARSAAAKLGLFERDVLVASTGVIGRELPMDELLAALKGIELDARSGLAFSRAIMTTDKIPKARALTFEVQGRQYRVGGAAKGAGMAHPDMATVFCFITTDAACEPQWLREVVTRVADSSFNMIDIDMDTSTSDTMFVMANGAAGGPRWGAGDEGAAALEQAFCVLAVELAKDLVRDAEGATTLIEACVEGARNVDEARRAARTVVASPLVKTMIYGRDPNLGRVLMALGRSGASLDLQCLRVSIADVCAFAEGVATALELQRISQLMNAPEVRLRIDLGVGSSSATAWGCDLTEEYVRINAHYTT